MAFRELRNFTEIIRVLGYPKIVSIESFRSPNFPLVAHLLSWLAHRYEPSIDIPLEIETEQDRVIFVKTAAHLLAVKASIKVNTKKIYLADGHAVQELLKIAKLLYNAGRKTDLAAGETSDTSTYDENVLNKITSLKKARIIASEITQKGADLHDLLKVEMENRKIKSNILSRQLKVPEMEVKLREAIKEMEKASEELTNKIDNVAQDEANLDVKINKKKAELERYQKRLATLKSVRPAFMDEYEKLEEEMVQVYDEYVVKFRCLTYLEHQLEDVDRSEQEKIQAREEQVRLMVEQMKQEEILRGKEEDSRNDEEQSQDESIDDEDENQIAAMNPRSNRDATLVTSANGQGKAKDTRAKRSLINPITAKRNVTGKIRVFGSMLQNDRETSLDSDLDLEEEDDDDDDDANIEDEDASDLDSEEELELLNITKPAHTTAEANEEEPVSIQKDKDNDSDNDF